MADIKISQMTAVSAVAGANEFEVNESGTSKKATVTQLEAYFDAKKWAVQAWVDYDTIASTTNRNSFGVSSLTDVGVGVTTVNFSTAFTSYYAVLVGGITGGVRIYPGTKASGSCDINTTNSAGTATDYSAVDVAFLGTV